MASLMIDGAQWVIRMELLHGRHEDRIEELMADFKYFVKLPSKGRAGSQGIAVRS
jgi:hypothetical protein